MDAKTHWETIYASKAPDAVSWYRPHLETSLALIERAAMGNKSASIVDVGGGESTLVDDLLARGYENITVLDVSQIAIEVTKKRLGRAAKRVRWITADITEVQGENYPPATSGMTVQFFIFLPQPNSGLHMFATSRAPLSRADT